MHATSLTRTTTALTKRDAPDENPVVYYTTEAWHMIQYLVETCMQEVGWLGAVTPLEDGDYLIDEIFVPDQRVSAAETEISADAIIELATDLITRGDDPGRLFYWGHSHVNMGVSPSGTDEREVSRYLENCPLFIRGIYNKKGDAKVDVFDRERGVVYQCVPNIPLHDIIPLDTQRALDAIIKANVKQHKYTTTSKQPLGAPPAAGPITQKFDEWQGYTFADAAELAEFKTLNGWDF